MNQRIYELVKWWITDMSHKPPEVTTDAYFEQIAREIAEEAVEQGAKDDSEG
jgi:hypothetical protein